MSRIVCCNIAMKEEAAGTGTADGTVDGLLYDPQGKEQ
jgi:hypothetical protein